MKRWQCWLAVGMMFVGNVLHANVGKVLPLEMIPTTVVQGEALTQWEADKLYVFECWATWCGPCRAAMKHTEELWQALKDDGHRVIGLNVMDRLSVGEVRRFLEQQSTRVTYANLLSRDKQLTSFLNVQGIPFAFVVRNGVIVWQGHPMRLDLSILELLSRGEKTEMPPAKPVLPKPYVTVAPHLVLERKADEALVFQRWKEAEAYQLEAMRAHPLHGRLSQPYTPSAWMLQDELPERGASFQGVDLQDLSAEGDLAPYAKLLGEPLPKLENMFTILSYWQPNPMIERYTSENASRLPGLQEQQRLLYPYRLKSIADKAYQAIAERQFASVPMIKPAITFLEGIDKEGLFGYNEQNNPPFVAIFLSGKCIYKGALELLPEALLRYGQRKEAFPTAKEWLQRIADERAHEASLKERFQAFRQEKDPTRAKEMIESLCADSRLGTWEMLLMPYRLGSFYQTQDVEGAARLVQRLYQHFYNSEHALEMLNKLIQSWPALRARTLGVYSLIAERLAQIQTQGGPQYCAAYYELAGELAKENQDFKRAEAMWIKALEHSPTGQRYRAIRLRCCPVPAP